MMNTVDNVPLPAGWDIKYDPRTRRNYFINYINKITTWEDPRQRPVQVLNQPQTFNNATDAQPPLQHGSTDIRQVYPSYPSQFLPQQAFQLPNPYMQELQRQDLSNGRPSPTPLRAHTAPIMGSHAIGHSASRIQETSFTTQAQITDESVTKIGTMFPTVSETHIRTLLLKYHNREAVVISALQVEKNPITTPGPYTPPTQRHILPPAAMTAVSAFQHTPPASLYSRGTLTGGTLTGGTLTGSTLSGVPAGAYGGSVGTVGGATTGTCTAYTSSPASSTYLGSPAFRHSPRPHTSPKMKLRYMKSLFPKADETVILDTLYAADDNLKSATDLLLSMGYEKRESTASVKGTPQKRVEMKVVGEKEMITAPRKRGTEDKQKMRERLSSKYADLAGQLINMALESADYDEERAGQILNMTKESSRAQSGTSRQSCSAQSDGEKGLSDGTAGNNAASVVATVAASTSGGDVLDSPSSTRTATTAEIGATSNGHEASPASASESPRNSAKSNSHTASVASSSEDKKSSTVVSFTKVDAMLAKRSKKKDVPKVSRGTSTTEDQEFKSPLLSKTWGPDPQRHRGPNDDLLLEDYVTWTGPNPSLLKGRSQTPFGSTTSRLNQPKYSPRGPDPELRKGPKCGLAKGSIYSHLTASVIAGGVSCGK